MIPLIIPGAGNPEAAAPRPSKTYKLSEERIAGVIDHIEAVKQAAFHILMTERYAYAIYPESYGVELERYKGRDMPYLEASIEDTLREALTQDERITDVRVISVEHGEYPDCAVVQFVVYTVFGGAEMGLSLNV